MASIADDILPLDQSPENLLHWATVCEGYAGMYANEGNYRLACRYAARANRLRGMVRGY